jgi:hypothetical protein
VVEQELRIETSNESVLVQMESDHEWENFNISSEVAEEFQAP